MLDLHKQRGCTSEQVPTCKEHRTRAARGFGVAVLTNSRVGTHHRIIAQVTDNVGSPKDSARYDAEELTHARTSLEAVSRFKYNRKLPQLCSATSLVIRHNNDFIRRDIVAESDASGDGMREGCKRQYCYTFHSPARRHD